MLDPSLSNGWVASGFEGVRAEFRRNIAGRGELGAAYAAYHQGKKVVDQQPPKTFRSRSTLTKSCRSTTKDFGQPCAAAQRQAGKVEVLQDLSQSPGTSPAPRSQLSQPSTLQELMIPPQAAGYDESVE
jgi:hypothetical protein